MENYDQLKNDTFNKFTDWNILNTNNSIPAATATIYIDESNLIDTVKQLNFQIDYLRLKKLFDSFMLVKKYYVFTASVDNLFLENALKSGHKLNMTSNCARLDWMRHNGFSVITKPIRVVNSSDNNIVLKGNLDVEFSIYATNHNLSAEHIILFTGDGDFTALVNELQHNNKIVTVVSSRCTKNGCLSEALYKKADRFIDLLDIKKYIALKQS